MPTWDQHEARCHVFAWKEGLLSAVGHDVKLEVKRFRVELDGDEVRATFDGRSIAAVCAVRAGKDDLAALSAKDRATIDGYVQNDILETRKSPEIRFESSRIELVDGAGEVEGALTLHGRTRDVTVTVAIEGDRSVARVRLAQPDFGITPFRAMLGALRIQAVVDVELSFPRLGA